MNGINYVGCRAKEGAAYELAISQLTHSSMQPSESCSKGPFTFVVEEGLLKVQISN